MNAWADLEQSLHEQPVFPVEPPDGVRHWSEIDRCVAFRKLVRTAAPTVLIYANANAGKRNPRQAWREGIMAGVFDYDARWHFPGGAQVEFKGYDARGRAGGLSQAQIDFGNRLHRLGHPVACFFTPAAAVEWLRSLGAPVRGVRS